MVILYAVGDFISPNSQVSLLDNMDEALALVGDHFRAKKPADYQTIMVLDENSITPANNTVISSNYCAFPVVSSSTAPASYHAFFDAQESILDGVKNLLKDYAKFKAALFFTLHLNRNHVETANRMLKEMPEDPVLAYNFLAKNYTISFRTNGSFKSRIHFALGKLAEYITANLIPNHDAQPALTR
jgi:hypothetical protein